MLETGNGENGKEPRACSCNAHAISDGPNEWNPRTSDGQELKASITIPVPGDRRTERRLDGRCNCDSIDNPSESEVLRGEEGELVLPSIRASSSSSGGTIEIGFNTLATTTPV